MDKAEAYGKRRQTKEMNKEKHSNMLIKNIILKIQENKLNNKVKDALSLLFVEAKWYKNFIIDYLEKGNTLKDFDTKIKTITHKDKDKNDVKVELQQLSSQMRRGTVDWIKGDLNKLHAKKLKGQKVGKLKHCKYVKAIPLNQYIKTFYFNENYTRVHIQGIKGTLRITGGEQLKNIKGDFDIQCAKLVRTAEGYFIHVTVYVEKEDSITRSSEEIGIDYGIKDAFTFSNGKKIKSTVDLKLIEKLKRKHRELSRKVKGGGKESVLVDVDFNIELVRTDKINVVYILNLLKDINRENKDEMTKSIDLILREIERSDNEKMRYKRDIMKAFVRDRFFSLDPDADILEAYNGYENEILQSDIESFATENSLESNFVSRILHQYFMDTKALTKETLRQEFSNEGVKGLRKVTNLINKTNGFLADCYNKFTVEGE